MPVTNSTNCKLEKLRNKLDSLSCAINNPHVPPDNAKKQPPSIIDSHHHTTKHALLAQLRDAETRWAAEKGSLQLLIRREQRRASQAEHNARRLEQQRDYQIQKSNHLKDALTTRDNTITSLEDQLREYEIGRATAQDLAEVEAERDELKATVDDLREQLETASSLLNKIERESVKFKHELSDLTESHMMARAEIEQLQSEREKIQNALDMSNEVRDGLQQTVEGFTWHLKRRKPILSRLVMLAETLPAADDHESD